MGVGSGVRVRVRGDPLTGVGFSLCRTDVDRDPARGGPVGPSRPTGPLGAYPECGSDPVLWGRNRLRVWPRQMS